jgi:hypothetical protein
MPATTSTKARKGDLVLVERIDRDYVIGQGAVEYTTYNVGVVASATRDGIAKTWRRVGWGSALISGGHAEPLQNSRLVSRYWVMPAKRIDVEAALRAAKAHHWPGHPGQPKAFDSLDEARSALRPCLLPHAG